jgi:hypothetical protein
MTRTCIGLIAGLVFAASAAARDSSLNVDDTSVVPALRVEMNSSGSFSFEGGFSTASGDSKQDVGAGDRVSMGGIPAFGPRQLSNDATLRELDAFVRWRTGTAPWTLELLGGLSFVHYEFNAGIVSSSGTPTAAVFGVGGLYRLRPQTTLQARYLLGKGVSSYTQDVSLDRLELALVQSLSKNISARLGYTVWDVTVAPTEPNSELHMRFRGPMLGLDIAF